MCLHVDKLCDSFFPFLHHVVEHVDDVAFASGAVLTFFSDLGDGVLELLDVPDDLRDVLVDVVHVLLLLVIRDDDIPNSTG